MFNFLSMYFKSNKYKINIGYFLKEKNKTKNLHYHKILLNLFSNYRFQLNLINH